MAISLGDNIKLGLGLPTDARYYSTVTNKPWTSCDEVTTNLAGGSGGVRYTGLTVNIGGTEYWFKDGIADIDLIEKTSGGGSGMLNWSGSTANAIGTYMSVSGICAQPNLTFDGTTLDVNGNVSPRTTHSTYLGSAIQYWKGAYIENICLKNSAGSDYSCISVDPSNRLCLNSYGDMLFYANSTSVLSLTPTHISLYKNMIGGGNDLAIGTQGNPFSTFNLCNYVEFKENSAPSSPMADYGRLYMDSSDEKIYFKNSSTTYDLTGGGIGWSNLAGGSTVAGCGTLPSGDTALCNTFYGVNAGKSTTTGHQNVGVGYNALSANTGGSCNVANGVNALNSNTNGSNNIANGFYALSNNRTGNNNIANGSIALLSNINGNNNIASGYQALYSNTSGNANIASGYQALYSNTSGNTNIAIGSCALAKNTVGDYNIGIGDFAVCSNTSGCNNVAIGSGTLRGTTTGCNNVAIGSGSMWLNTVGCYNIAFGISALASLDNATGNRNIAIGLNALSSNLNGSDNVVIGTCARGDGSYGTRNVAIGCGAAQSSTDWDRLHIANCPNCTLIYGEFVNKLVCIDEKLITCHFQMLSGATNGYVLTSDASGNATWEASSGGGGSVNMSGNTTNGITTYVDSNTICSEPNLTFDGSNLYVNGNVGIGTASPILGRLQIYDPSDIALYVQGGLFDDDGTSIVKFVDSEDNVKFNITGSGCAVFSDTVESRGLIMTTGAVDGYVLTSDANGVASWELAPTGGTDLSTTHNATTVVINSSTGTNATINAATASLAGIVTNTTQTFAGTKTTSVWCATTSLNSATCALVGTDLVFSTGSNSCLRFNSTSSGVGNTLFIYGNNGAANSAGGNVCMVAGIGGNMTGTGGHSYIIGGAGGTTAVGGNVYLCGGAGSTGGDILLIPGNGISTEGNVNLYYGGTPTLRLNTHSAGVCVTGSLDASTTMCATTCVCSPVICSTGKIDAGTCVVVGTNLVFSSGADRCMIWDTAISATGYDMSLIGQTSSVNAGGHVCIIGGCFNGSTGGGGDAILKGGNSTYAGGNAYVCGGTGAGVGGGSVYICAGTGSTTGGVYIQNGTSVQAQFLAASCVSLRFNGTEKFKTVTNGICLTTNCGFAVDWVATSDCRLKENIVPINNALSIVTQLCGVCYNLCDDENHENRIGLIAQDVDKVLPEIVSHSNPSEDDKKYGITDDKLGLKYDKLTAVLIEAIKELKTENQSLQAQINELKNK